jgi:hypothetical protein
MTAERKKTKAQIDAEIKAALNGAENGILARRKTYDDKVVLLWSDGSLTWALGNVIKGSPNARTADGIKEALAAGWLVMGEISIVMSSEVPRLIESARKAVRRARARATYAIPGDVRAEFFKDAPLKPHWITLETDRDGKPTIRVWRLPRMTHPGMAIWDTLRQANRGRYEVMTEKRAGGLGQRSSDGTYATTGVRFHDLDKLSKYLRETSALTKKRV